jgi:8-oxo-dGTP diphosphatase
MDKEVYVKYLRSLPEKRIAAGAIFFNKAGELLLLKPIYKEGWLTPGGVIEKFESPKEGAKREVLEELGLSISLGRLLLIDYIHRPEYGDEHMIFQFDGGVLTQDQINAISLQEEEIGEYRFVAEDDPFIQTIGGGTQKRIPDVFRAIQEGRFLYMENGVVVDG